MANLDTQSQSFGRELLTSEVSLYNKKSEEYFYIEKNEIFNLSYINPVAAKLRRSKLLSFVKTELNDFRDDNFIRNSYFCEMMDINDFREHLEELKSELEQNGISNFLIEFHLAKEDNTNHFQYTGNDGIRANEIIIKYINKNQLSTHFLEKNKETKKSIVESLEDKLNKLDELIKPKISIEDKIRLAKEQELNYQKEMNNIKENNKNKMEEINNVIHTINNAKSNRR